MPIEMALLRHPVWALRRSNLFALEGQQSLMEASGAIGLVGDEQHAARDCEGSQVESLVVQDAEG
jgi:hypothetical protein